MPLRPRLLVRLASMLWPLALLPLPLPSPMSLRPRMLVRLSSMMWLLMLLMLPPPLPS